MLRVFHLEDSAGTHELMLAHLRPRAGHRGAARCASDFEAAFRAAGQDWDVVLSDFNLPGFSAWWRWRSCASGREIPFILVSGEIGETRRSRMRNGASDYLLRSTLLPGAGRPKCGGESTRCATRASARPRAEQVAPAPCELPSTCRPASKARARDRPRRSTTSAALTALKFDLWIARHTTDEGAARLRVHGAETVTPNIRSSQRIMHNLRPAILEQGLVAALQWIAPRFEPRTGIPREVRIRRTRRSGRRAFRWWPTARRRRR